MVAKDIKLSQKLQDMKCRKMKYLLQITNFYLSIKILWFKQAKLPNSIKHM